MLSRYDISDAHWDRIENLLPGGYGGVGRDNRLFVDAIRYLAETGIAWADLPTCDGLPQQPVAVLQPLVPEGRLAEHRRGTARRGHRVAQRGQQLCPRGPRSRRREKKAAAPAARGPRRSRRGRGGLGTRIHAAVSPLGHPVAIELTGAEAGDSPRLPGLIAGVDCSAVPADKACDSDANREAIRAAGAEPCIPSRENRKAEVAYDRHLHKRRDAVERDFARVKQYRRVATRYDKRARNYLGFVWVASINIMLA